MKKKKLRRRLKESPSTEALKKISEDFGDLGFLSDEEQLHVLPTILPSLNRASLIGGIPGGCIIEFHGPNQGGKTVLGMSILCSAQRAGHIAGVLDYEGSFKDKKWPTAVGIDLRTCIYEAPDTFEQGADWLIKFIRGWRKKQAANKALADKMMFWLVDSVNAMLPQAELDESVGKQNFGLQANLMSRWLKKVNTVIKGSNISVIMINQERANVGAKAFQKKWKEAGGEALKFYAHFRLRVLQSAQSKVGDRVIGKEHRFIVEKNKVSAPDELGYFYTSNGKYPDDCPLGLDLPRTLFKEGLIQEIITKSGKGKYTCDYFGESERGLTEKKFLQMLSENQKLVGWLSKQFQRRLEL